VSAGAAPLAGLKVLDLSRVLAGPFAGRMLAACWAEDRDIAEEMVLLDCATASGLDGGALAEAADSEEIRRIAQADLDRAIEIGVFGAPTYVVDGELFWGQDRLDFVERALAR